MTILSEKTPSPAVMGVINATPDSFSDGGRFIDPGNALSQARAMVEAGVDWVDIGGESTRPGATPVPLQEELDRVCPVIEAIHRELDVPISLDTSAPEVMREGARLGISMINDVRSLEREGAVAAARDTGLAVCIMHRQGEPETMQDRPEYSNVLEEVLGYLDRRAAQLQDAGIPGDRLLYDPGFGFGKTLEHNLVLLENLEAIVARGWPVLVGMSRKSMIGGVTGRPVEERMAGSVAAAAMAMMKGAAIVRVHDVKETVDAARMVRAAREQGSLRA
ncbi:MULTISPECIES: dihydropteroate synthase [Halomonadaceae]|uniref:Dihydropteroate synthase n=1 Tax=Vreelandella halophila TaxID=86177 RepID=A0A9X4YCX7_9GAMM|nr:MULTISPECIES: dihydropteroate synthase [Halomonas]MYL27347.1 dihydropteroate synthase [Halomonas utahensis]MYL76094.1 dihydropteroate synthase [Halomonas sp. 22501_18_FS]